MQMATGIRRVIIIVLDGLRPDAIDAFGLTHVQRLMAGGAWTRNATTVAPSLTTAAMTSLMTGVSPARHGIASDRVFIPRSNAGLSPLPDVLAEHGQPSSSFMGELPAIFRGLATRVARRLGFGASRFSGQDAPGILAAARATLETQRRGLILLHWPDADREGHAHGWMSDEYGAGCARMDETLGMLVHAAGVGHDPGTLLIGLADHGGGGTSRKDHDSDHPTDRTIPLFLAGRGVARGELGPARLIDVPATVLWALGLNVPASYEGRVLDEAFTAAREPAGAVA